MISRTFPKPISSMKGATALNDGAAGLVPAPVAGDQAKFLRADGTWSNVQEMTGATEQAAGASGLVPAPAAGDQGKMLNGGGQWALPGVVTINGRSPNPVTGDIVVIEGGGSSSYGSYRLDAVIATTDWVEDNGAYVAQVTNSLITANMDGVETWLDDESAMLGDTSFATSEGMLTITTAVMPVASWSLHVSLAVNGADVLADVSALQTAVTNLQASDAAQTANMSKIIPILSGDTNNSGYTINSGEYFEVEGTLYKATAAIPNGSAWAGSATAMGAGETAINSLNNNIQTVNSKIDTYIFNKTYSPTTSSTGAVGVESADRPHRFVGAVLTSGGPGFVFRRDESYFTVFNNSMQPLANTAVTFIAYFAQNVS